MYLGVSLLDHLTDVEPTKFALTANNLAILLVIAPTPEIGIDRMIMKISMKMELLVVEQRGVGVVVDNGLLDKNISQSTLNK
jgi:hypothetical protein